MKLLSTYPVKIKESKYSRVFQDTVRLYRGAVDFYITVMLKTWGEFSAIDSQKEAVNHAESLTVTTMHRPEVSYDFGKEFYKFPSYLRRAAIAEAYGKVCSYYSNLQNWQNLDPKERKGRPSLPKAGYVFPAMYRDNCFVRTGTYTARIKVWVRNTWDWINITLRKNDADYILHHCKPFKADEDYAGALKGRKECVPTLQKRGKEWFLDFVFEEKVTLHDTDILKRTILAVDLGINNACVCSAMQSDGTIIGRKFLTLSKEYDCLRRKIDHIKRAQCHGSRHMPKLWGAAKGINDHIAVQTAQFIVDTAILYGADVIVFEHLDVRGKKRGSKRQRLHLWRANYVQDMVTHKAHRIGIRISRVNAWGTSRFAYDGSGRVKRGKESEKTENNYSICEFQSGKIYNCDLNASYNIGARYFVRELIKSLPETERQRILAKEPEYAKRSTCTLSTLIRFNADFHATA